jgi:hypothetical protein
LVGKIENHIRWFVIYQQKVLPPLPVYQGPLHRLDCAVLNFALEHYEEQLGHEYHSVRGSRSILHLGLLQAATDPLAMPAIVSKSSKPRATKPMTGGATHLGPRVPKPSKPYRGYMTDAWCAYLSDCMKRMTKAQVEATLVRAGITDKNGKLTAPYRNA